MIALAAPLAVAQSANSLPQYGSKYFNVSEPNYFIAGFGDGPPLATGEYGHQIKFRVAVRYQLISFLGGESGVHVGYRQNSFWHLYEKSAPFFDNNYNPQVFVYLDGRKRSKTFSPGARFLVEHESNGRDGAESRSWNRLTAGIDAGDPQDDWWFATLKLWNAFHIGIENQDIQKYAGHGELALNFQPWHETGRDLAAAGIATRLRLAGEKAIPSCEVNFFFGSALARIVTQGVRDRVAGRINFSVVAQYFTGTAENLLVYKERHSVWRLGLATVR